MLVLVTGGAASGKSELAERIVCELAKGKPMLYVAAMETEGEEAQKRIAAIAPCARERDLQHWSTPSGSTR